MIAVVLLIAFTVAVGGILSVWLSTLSTTQTTIVSSGTEKQVRCAASSISILEVRYPSGTSGCVAPYNCVNVTVRYDSGVEALSNITVEVSARGSINSSTSTARFSPGESRVVSLIANYPPEVASARGFCQDSVSITAECKAGQPCMLGSG